METKHNKKSVFLVLTYFLFVFIITSCGGGGGGGSGGTSPAGAITTTEPPTSGDSETPTVEEPKVGALLGSEHVTLNVSTSDAVYSVALDEGSLTQGFTLGGITAGEDATGKTMTLLFMFEKDPGTIQEVKLIQDSGEKIASFTQNEFSLVVKLNVSDISLDGIKQLSISNARGEHLSFKMGIDNGPPELISLELDPALDSVKTAYGPGEVVKLRARVKEPCGILREQIVDQRLGNFSHYGLYDAKTGWGGGRFDLIDEADGISTLEATITIPPRANSRNAEITSVNFLHRCGGWVGGRIDTAALKIPLSESVIVDNENPQVISFALDPDKTVYKPGDQVTLRAKVKEPCAIAKWNNKYGMYYHDDFVDAKTGLKRGEFDFVDGSGGISTLEARITLPAVAKSRDLRLTGISFMDRCGNGIYIDAVDIKIPLDLP